MSSLKLSWNNVCKGWSWWVAICISIYGISHILLTCGVRRLGTDTRKVIFDKKWTVNRRPTSNPIICNLLCCKISPFHALSQSVWKKKNLHLSPNGSVGVHLSCYLMWKTHIKATNINKMVQVSFNAWFWNLEYVSHALHCIMLIILKEWFVCMCRWCNG